MREGITLLAAVIGMVAVLFCSEKVSRMWSEAPAPMRGNDGLLSSAIHDNAEGVVYALAHGGDCDCRDDMGRTPLMWAAANGSVRVAERLIAAGADVNACDNHGWKPLLFAASTNRPQVVTV